MSKYINPVPNYSAAQICELPAKMLLFKDDVFCKLLSLKWTRKDTLKFLAKKNFLKKQKIKCGYRPRKYTLEGFYIKRKILNLNSTVNCLEFYPLWSVYNQIDNYLYRYVSNKLPMHNSGISNYQDISGNCGDVVSIISNQTGSFFCHNDLQFSSYFNGFDQAYISYYDLFMIVNYAEYIGITGARVTSGNFVAMDTEGNQDTMLIGECDKQYFTYRFIGFKQVECSRLKKDEIALARVDRSRLVLNSAIPAETWAVPCPPRWVPD